MRNWIFLILLLGHGSQGSAQVRKCGPEWCREFPHTEQLGGLSGSFMPKARNFIDALREAGATVHVSSTRRPAQRQYLMHWSHRIGLQKYLLHTTRPCVPGPPGAMGTWFAPAVPPYVNTVGDGRRVDILWTWDSPRQRVSITGCNSANCINGGAHYSLFGECMDAARHMSHGYRIVHPPGLQSRHVTGQAIDMSISWNGALEIVKADGQVARILSKPTNGLNPDLHGIGATYGVHKLVSDEPHWSEDGR